MMPPRHLISRPHGCHRAGLILVAIIAATSVASTAGAYSLEITSHGDATKWELGAGTASTFDPATPPGTPGGATWSIMPAEIQISLGDHTFHSASAMSTDLSSLFPGDEAVAIDWALNQWASVSGFTNLGQVTDGGGFNGVSEEGDIRVGAYEFNIVGGSVILGHTVQPGTTALDPPFGSRGGDMHLNNDGNASAPNQVVWVDDETATGAGNQYDFLTVVLHEMGHALGLGHVNDPNSIMALYSTRGHGLRTLSADDIAGIQAIYGPPTNPPPDVPEPTTVLLYGLGLVGLLLRRRPSHG